MKGIRNASLGVRRGLAAFVLALGAGTADPAGAQNLIANGDFATANGVTGWETFYVDANFDVSLSWAPFDRLLAAGSGAALLLNASPSAGTSVGTLPLLTTACTAIASGEVLDAGGWTQIPSGQTTTGFSRVVVAWYTTPTCTMFGSYAPNLATTTSTGIWVPLDNLGLEPPPGTVAFKVGLAVRKNEAGGTLAAYFDDVYAFAPEPGSSIAGAAAFAVLGALAAAARRSERGRPSPIA